MKKFETPEVEVTTFAVEDVITASGVIMPTEPPETLPPNNENELPWG